MGGHIVLVNSEIHQQPAQQLAQQLAGDGYCALSFRTAEEAVSYLREPSCPAAVAVFSVRMRRQSDYTALTDLTIARPELQILYSSEEAREAGVDPGQFGASIRQIQALDQPLDHPEVIATLRRALKRAASAAIDAAGDAGTVTGAIGLAYSEEFLRRVGAADVPVLLSGETGVGKEVMARRLRAYSRRREMPFLKLNCAALPPELAESELFGSAKGAFTGAVADRQGRFETAQGGTILLDEIGDMDLRLQTKLLQVLQDGEIQPLGSNRTIKVNVRVMAATHRDLGRAIQEGTFREDLYYRLNVIRIVIPPLRERSDEILPLAETLLSKHLPAGQQMPAMNGELRRFLTTYRWPGNVRELENVMRRFLVYQDSGLIIRELLDADLDRRPTLALTNVTSFPESTNGAQSARARDEDQKAGGRADGRADGVDQLAEAARIAETELILDALETNRWNRRQAAASLQIEYKAFLYKMQKYGIVASKVKARDLSA